MMIPDKYFFPIAVLLLCLSGCSDDNDSDDEPVPPPAVDTPDGSTFVVASVSPADAAEVEELPAAIALTFNRAVFADTLSVDQVALVASGGDSTFVDGNEVTVMPSGVSVSDTTATIDLAGVTGGDDNYRLTLDGATITDAAGVLLDGDGDGNDGGDFVSTFAVATPVAPVTTFSFIQDNVFTPTCAVSGCHAGASPAAGMDLSAGQAFANIVGVNSGQVPTLLRVNPGDADNSYLVQKIEGTATVGERMPRGGPPLSSELIQNIREWIDAGAENN